MEAIPPAVIENWRAVAAATTCARAETAPAANRIENKRTVNRLIGKRCVQSGQIFALGEETSVVPGLKSLAGMRRAAHSGFGILMDARKSNPPTPTQLG